MPARLALYDDTQFKNTVRTLFPSYQDHVGELTKNYNIAPTNNIAVLLNNGIYTMAHFGLIPSWAKEKKSMQINARSESLYEKSSFREPFKSKRCIVCINGFYEWKEEFKEKTPYLFHATQENFLALAALYDEWYDSSSQTLIRGIALITTEPNEKVQTIHDRMPVILESKDWQSWLHSTDLNEVNQLLKPCSNEYLNYYQVSSYVNKIDNEGESCIQKSSSMVQGSLF